MYSLWLLPTDWIDCNSLTVNIVFMLYLSGLSQPIKLDKTSARPLNGQIYVCVCFSFDKTLKHFLYSIHCQFTDVTGRYCGTGEWPLFRLANGH